MNVVLITGNLTKDPTITKTTAGITCVSGSVAVRRDYKNPNGEYDVDFIDFVAYRSVADYLGKYAHKGGRVEIKGRWRTRKFTDSDGNERRANDVEVEEAMFFPKHERSEIDG